MKKKILIVDDEIDIRLLIAGLLEDEGYDVLTAENSEEAYEESKKHAPDLVILDIWLHGSRDDGIDILKNLRSKDEMLPIIMISGHGTIETAVSTIKMGAYDFIEKPFKSDRLLLMVHRALENLALKRENAELKKSKKTQKDQPLKYIPSNVKALLDKVAASNSRALITGEVGTGKIFAAQYIHEQSSRNKNAFVTFNCAQNSAQNIRDELFDQNLLELAHQGTLVLDEIGMLPLEIQGNLLHFLQESSYYKTGSNHKTICDVRVIATSSENLMQKVAMKTFREDLFYRLNVVPISIAPLRERKNEISGIIESSCAFTFTEEAMNALISHPWPGNTKQLHNILEWLNIMHSKDKTAIDYSDLPPAFNMNKKTLQTHINNVNDNSGDHNTLNLSALLSLGLRDARESFERAYIQKQIDKFDGNISKTAHFIGMERSALHRKLKTLDIFSDEKQNSA